MQVFQQGTSQDLVHFREEIEAIRLVGPASALDMGVYNTRSTVHNTCIHVYIYMYIHTAFPLFSRHLQHPHVGRVFGVVSPSPYYMVMELSVNGDLKTFLLTAYQRAPDEGYVFSTVLHWYHDTLVHSHDHWLVENYCHCAKIQLLDIANPMTLIITHKYS